MLYDYQNDLINTLRETLKNQKNALVYASVSFGKTHCMARICELSSLDILITVPRVSLVEQTASKINGASIYCASLGKRDIGRITVSTIQSIKNVNKKWGIIQVDEAHVNQLSIIKFLKKTNYKYAIAWTGTPEGTKGFWGDPCYKMSIKDLSELGYLTPLIMKSARLGVRPNLDGVRIQSGDFVKSDLYDKYRELVYLQISDAISKLHGRKQVLWIAINIEHAETIAKIINAPAVHSKNKNSIKIINEFKNGLHKNLVSVAMVNVGFSVETADALVLMRATKSRALFVQTVGRILRLHPEKKDALLLDYGRVVENLGHPYKIDFNSNIVPEKLKICDVCDEFNQQTAKTCSKCDSAFMSMCAICLSPKKYGEKCCVKKTPPKKTFNLTEYSYDPDRAYVVLSMSIHSYKAKSGNDCWKVTYVLDDFTSVTEYLKKEWKNKEDIKKPKTLKAFINGKYRNVKSKSY